MSKIADMMAAGLAKVTKEFTKEKRRVAAQSDRLTYAQLARLRAKNKKRDLEETLVEACEQIMPEAYLKVSDNGSLPANARQMMYAARPLVMALTGGKIWDNSSYFTQKLLNGYLKKHPTETVGWKIVYDARGHLVEPHVSHKLGLGTLEVGYYIRSWSHPQNSVVDIELDDLYPTIGPANRFGWALFVEKEGFNELLVRSEIAARWDLAMSECRAIENHYPTMTHDEICKQWMRCGASGRSPRQQLLLQTWP
jgi:hypothetical protein